MREEYKKIFFSQRAQGPSVLPLVIGVFYSTSLSPHYSTLVHFIPEVGPYFKDQAQFPLRCTGTYCEGKPKKPIKECRPEHRQRTC